MVVTLSRLTSDGDGLLTSGRRVGVRLQPSDAVEALAYDLAGLAVALGGELRSSGKHARKSGGGAAGADGEISFAASDHALTSIAAETGGYPFFPATDRDFSTAYSRIAALVRYQYSLGIDADMHDGRYHTVQVTVVEPAGHNGKQSTYGVNTRRGFLAPAP